MGGGEGARRVLVRKGGPKGRWGPLKTDPKEWFERNYRMQV